MKHRSLVFLLIGTLFLVACTPASKVTSDEQAYQLVQNVPEVQEYVTELVKGDTKPYMRLESVNKDPFYEFYVGSSQPTHTVIWRRFKVDRKTGQIKVYDNKADEYVSLDEWRTRVKSGLMSK